LRPSNACVTEVLDLATLAADTDAAPAPDACAAGLGPPGDLELVRTREMLGFWIAAEGATGLNPATPLAEAASWVAWLMAPLNVAAPVLAPVLADVSVAAGLSVAACEVTAGTAARQASAPTAARIDIRFTDPNPPCMRFLSHVT